MLSVVTGKKFYKNNAAFLKKWELKLIQILICSFPCGSAGKETACNEGDLGLIPGLGRSPGEENGYPL